MFSCIVDCSICLFIVAFLHLNPYNVYARSIFLSKSMCFLAYRAPLTVAQARYPSIESENLPNFFF